MPALRECPVKGGCPEWDAEIKARKQVHGLELEEQYEAFMKDEPGTGWMKTSWPLLLIARDEIAALKAGNDTAAETKTPEQVRLAKLQRDLSEAAKATPPQASARLAETAARSAARDLSELRRFDGSKAQVAPATNGTLPPEALTLTLRDFDKLDAEDQASFVTGEGRITEVYPGKELSSHQKASLGFRFEQIRKDSKGAALTARAINNWSK